VLIDDILKFIEITAFKMTQIYRN